MHSVQKKNSCRHSKYVEISTLYLPCLPCCCKPLAKQRFPVRNQPINQYMPLIAPLLHSLHFWLSAKKKQAFWVLSWRAIQMSWKCHSTNSVPNQFVPASLPAIKFLRTSNCRSSWQSWFQLCPVWIYSCFNQTHPFKTSKRPAMGCPLRSLFAFSCCFVFHLLVFAGDCIFMKLKSSNIQPTHQLHSGRTDSLPLSVPRWYDPPAFDQALLHESPWKAKRDNFPPVKPAWVRLLFVAIPPGWAQRSCSPQCLAQTARHKNFNLGCLPPPRQADNKWERQNRRN